MSGNDLEAEAKDLEYIQDLVESERRFPVLDRVDEPLGAPRKVGNLGLVETEFIPPVPDSSGKIGSAGRPVL